MERSAPLSEVATSFLEKAASFFLAEGYRLGADVSHLLTERQQKVADFALERLGDIIMGSFGLRSGPTGTKKLVAETVTQALAPFTEFTDLLAWRPSEIVPVFVADDVLADDLTNLLAAYFKLAQNAANAISEIKYGGFVRVFPLLLFT
ncbi:MAG: hypothetical protein WA324_13515, partial [Bryobacteraceae bacterium]